MACPVILHLGSWGSLLGQPTHLSHSYFEYPGSVKSRRSCLKSACIEKSGVYEIRARKSLIPDQCPSSFLDGCDLAPHLSHSYFAYPGSVKSRRSCLKSARIEKSGVEEIWARKSLKPDQCPSSFLDACDLAPHLSHSYSVYPGSVKSKRSCLNSG